MFSKTNINLIIIIKMKFFFDFGPVHEGRATGSSGSGFKRPAVKWPSALGALKPQSRHLPRARSGKHGFRLANRHCVVWQALKKVMTVSVWSRVLVWWKR